MIKSLFSLIITFPWYHKQSHQCRSQWRHLVYLLPDVSPAFGFYLPRRPEPNGPQLRAGAVPPGTAGRSRPAEATCSPLPSPGVQACPPSRRPGRDAQWARGYLPTLHPRDVRSLSPRAAGPQTGGSDLRQVWIIAPWLLVFLFQSQILQF